MSYIEVTKEEHRIIRARASVSSVIIGIYCGFTTMVVNVVRIFSRRGARANNVYDFEGFVNS